MSDTARPKSSGDKLGFAEVNADLPVVLTAGETINGGTLPVPVYMHDGDNEVKACDANDQAELEFIGFAISNSTDGNSITVQTHGVVAGFSGLDIGKKYYVQDAVGTIGTSKGTYAVLVGFAVSATQILVQHGNFQYCGTETDTTDVFTPPAVARHAVVKFETVVAGVVANIDGEFLVSEVGKTDGQIEGMIAPADQGNSHQRVTVTISWAAGSITITTSNGTISGTAYYYW